MYTRLLPLFFALALSAALVRAEETATAAAAAGAKPDDAPKPVRVFAHPPATPTPAATPVPHKKPGLLTRIFGSKGKPAATPATPAPTPTHRRFQPRKPAPEEKTDAETPKPGPDKTEEPKTHPPGPEDPPEKNPPATPVPRSRNGKKPPAGTDSKASTKEEQAVAKAVAGGDTDAIEKAKYDEVKSRAITDPRVVELRNKADGATSEEEGSKALRAYNKALFDKMRSLDSSLEPRIDRMEAAILKRLED